MDGLALSHGAEGLKDLGEGGLLEGLGCPDEGDLEVHLFVRGPFDAGFGLCELFDEFEEAGHFEAFALLEECGDGLWAEVGGEAFGVGLGDEEIAEVGDEVAEEA